MELLVVLLLVAAGVLFVLDWGGVGRRSWLGLGLALVALALVLERLDSAGLN